MKAGCPLIAALALCPQTADGASREAEEERPNILWLTFEDTSYYEFGCYGNKDVTTPIIDSLAENGLQFMNAYSCGPQSSPARSTLITGCYSTTYAMDWHRKKVATPAGIFFPQYLRDAGYYCTNNQKTDYNSTSPDNGCWDECGPLASYNSPDRKDGQPFFAVFNSNLTHMSRLASVHTDGRRDFTKQGINTETLELPAQVPDMPEMRSDYAFHLEGINDIDKWVKIFLDDLKDKGLSDNTAIFIFSDHGGCLPRGKAFSYETSFRVPLVIYLPEKWQHLSRMPVGQKTDRPVSFADMGPTILSMAGIGQPEYMQGHPFLGKADKKERKYQIGYMTNRTIHFAPSRTISDGKYKYIRYYIPYKKDALFNYFQWQMPANIHWDKAYFGQDGKKHLAAAYRRPFEYAPAESFYNLENDPFELDDLIDDPEYKNEIEALRKALAAHIRKSTDIGFLPVNARQGNVIPYDRVRQPGYDLERLYALAELTATVGQADIPYLKGILKSGAEDEFKFWATVNLAVLAERGALTTDGLDELTRMLESGDPMIAQEAAFALCHTSKSKAGFDYLALHPELTSALESLSLDPEMKDKFPKNVMDMLYRESARFEAIPRNRMPNAGDGICARKVLVNLGIIPPEDMYGSHVYEIGLKVNKTRRHPKPLP